MEDENNQEFIEDEEVIDLDEVNEMKIEFSKEKVKSVVKCEQSLFIMDEQLKMETNDLAASNFFVKTNLNTINSKKKTRKLAHKIKPCLVVIEKCPAPPKSSKDETLGKSKTIDRTSKPKKAVRKKRTQKIPESTFHCKYCDKSFPWLCKLERHTKVHTKVRPFKCKDCGKAYTEESTLKIHQNCFHKGLRPYKCDLCDKSFGRNGDLKSHKEDVHEGVTVECPICGKGGLTKSSLKGDLKNHTGVAKVKCTKCDKTFRNKHVLKKHQESVHEGIRPLKCDVCGKRFTGSASLKIHIRSHKGVKHYECKECGLRFTSSGRLWMHVKGVHKKLRPHKCLECEGNSKQDTN